MKLKLLFLGLSLFVTFFNSSMAQDDRRPTDWNSVRNGNAFNYVVDDPSAIADLAVTNLTITALNIDGTNIVDPELTNFGKGTNTLKLTNIKTFYQNLNKDLHDTKITITGTDATVAAKTASLTIIDKSKEEDSSPSSQLEQQRIIREHIRSNYGLFIRKYRDERQNIIIANNTVHIFIDEYGKTYFGGFPTTAREDYNYTIHVFYDRISSTTKSINVNVEGLYEPNFDIYGAGEVNNARFMIQSTGDEKDDKKVEKLPRIMEIIFDNNGPFTESFTLSMAKTSGEDEEIVVIPSKIIKVAPVHHISLMVGLVSSFLTNPTDIRKGALDNGDTTLFANDPTTRGLITLMAVFYPKPRNLLFPPKEFLSWERLGIMVGTRIDTDLSENFLGGLSYDLARGLSIAGGVHYGRVNSVAGHRNFNFGEDTFTGDLNVIKEWRANYFIGANIDLRVFGILFNPQGQTR